MHLSVYSLSILSLLFFLIGFMSSMIGIGGGLFYVPLLLLAGFDMNTAVPASLTCIATAGIVAGWRYWKSKLASVGTAVGIGFSSLLSATLAGAFVQGLPDDIHFLVFMTFATLILLTSIIPKRKTNLEQSPEMGKHIPIRTSMLIGVIAGVASATFGIGGGVVIVPSLSQIVGTSMVSAVATSALTLSITAAAGLFGHLIAFPNIHAASKLIVSALPLAGASAIGALAGSTMVINNERIRQKLRLIFSAAMLAMILMTLYKRM